MNYPVVMSTPELDRAFSGICALPTSYLLDREVRIVQKHVGLLTALRTALETRVLAGLPAYAAIEEVDPVQRAKLDDAAQAPSIPAIDLAAIPATLRPAVLQQLHS